MEEKADTTDHASSANVYAEDSVRSPKIRDELHQLFTRFEAFNFDEDETFQAGLAKIIRRSGVKKGRENALELLKIKTFYYSKNMEHMDFTAYLEWRRSHMGHFDGETSGTDDSSGTADGVSPDQQNKANDVNSSGDAQAKVCGSVTKTSEHTLCGDDRTRDWLPLCDAQNEESQQSGGQSSSAVCQESTSHLVNVDDTKVEVERALTAKGTIKDVEKERSQAGTKVRQSGTDVISAELDMGHAGMGTKQDYPKEQQTGRDITHAEMNMNHVSIEMNQNGNMNQADTDDTQTGRAGHQTGTGLYCDRNRAGVCPPDNEGGQMLSFAEIAEMIQSGKPIPGLAQIEVVPTNMAPSPSRLHRTKKPWEE